MIDPTQELIFTVVPTPLAVDAAIIPLSILLTPRLRGAPTLSSFDDMLSWTERLRDNGLTFTLSLNGLPYTAGIDTSGLRPELWTALFGPDTPVDDYVFDDHTQRPIISYPVRDALLVLKSAFQYAGRDLALPNPEQGRAGAQARGRLTSLLQGLDIHWDDEVGARIRAQLRHEPTVLYGSAGLPDGSFQPGGDGLPDATQLPAPGTDQATHWRRNVAARFALFHHMPVAPPQPAPPLDSLLDFHRVISSLSSYPQLMRALGLVFDLQVPADAIPATPVAPGTITVTGFAPGWDLAIAPPRRQQPSTAYYMVTPDHQQVFFVAPRQGLENPTLLGLLILDPKDYCIAQLDVDGAMFKTMILAEGLGRLAPARHPEVFDDANTLPSLRSSGLSLVSDRRAQALLTSLARAKTFNDQLESPAGPQAPLFAEDLVRGYRIDIWDSRTGAWHSLHRRNGRYEIGDQVFETADEEGFTQLAVTRPAPDPNRDPNDDDFYLHESIARWHGWSLSVHRPGKALTRSADPTKAVPPDDPNELDPADRENEPLTSFGMKVSYSVVPGSLPSLRFGRQYRLRVRPVDVAGNSLSLDDPFLDELSRAFALPAGDDRGFAYLRYEPVPPPVVVLRDESGISGPGGTLERLVIRTFNSDPSLDGLAPDTTGGDRHIVPPRATVEMGERHGIFDDASGKLKGDPATYALIASHDDPATSNFPTAMVPGQNHPVPIETDAQMPAVPYIPDPLARGAALRDLPGTPSGSRGLTPAAAGPVTYTPLQDANPRPGSATLAGFNGAGNWTERRPFRLALQEGSGPPQWSADGRVLTVFLPKGTSSVVPLSSYVTGDDLKLMGVWQWLREFIEASMNTAEGDEFLPGSDVDVIAHILQRAVEGGHWMLTPPRLLTLVSAVQQPLGRPEFVAINVQHSTDQFTSLRPLKINDEDRDRIGLELAPIEAWRVPGAIDAYLIGGLQVHGLTTEKVDLIARWDDPVDDPSIPGAPPTTMSHATHVDELPLPSLGDEYLFAPGDTGRMVGFYDRQQDTICFAVEGDTLGRTPGGQLINYDAVPRHHFNDTKYHRVSYTAISTSRYRDCFADADLDFTRRSDPVVVDVPAAARPAAPMVDYVIPTFGWERETSTNLKRSVRFGGGLRVYLERPWFSSGDGEMLGVVCWNENNGRIDQEQAREAWKAFITQWGVDPIWQTLPLPLPTPTPYDFPDAAAREFALSLEERTPLASDGTSGRVDVAAFPVAFDNERNQWYCDLAIACDSYTPFVRLALARYQPMALADAKLSRVVLAEFVQLTPERTATVTADPYHPRRIRVSVSGTAPRGPVPTEDPLAPPLDRPTRVTVTVQQRAAGVPGELGWGTAPPEVAAVTLDRELPAGGLLDLMLWSGRVTFADDPVPGSFRILITEHEYVSADYAEVVRAGGEALPPIFAAPGRLIYAETVDLDVALVGPPD